MVRSYTVWQRQTVRIEHPRLGAEVLEQTLGL
jgi:hypothetical protein